MLQWLRRRQDARRLAQADAEALIRDHDLRRAANENDGEKAFSSSLKRHLKVKSVV